MAATSNKQTARKHRSTATKLCTSKLTDFDPSKDGISGNGGSTSMCGKPENFNNKKSLTNKRSTCFRNAEGTYTYLRTELSERIHQGAEIWEFPTHIHSHQQDSARDHGHVIVKTTSTNTITINTILQTTIRQLKQQIRQSSRISTTQQLFTHAGKRRPKHDPIRHRVRPHASANTTILGGGLRDHPTTSTEDPDPKNARIVDAATVEYL